MKKIRIFAILTISFTVLTILYTRPLIIHFTTHAAGDKSDGVIFVWSLWWVKKALFELHKLPFFCTDIFYPLGINLVLHTLNIFNGIISTPLQILFGLIPAHNFMLMFSYIVSGLGMYILCFYLTKDRIASFLGAVMFAFCPFKLNHGSHFNLLSTEWIPFYVYFLIKSIDMKNFFYGLLAGLFLGLTLYCSYYLAAFLMVFTIFFFIYKGISNAFEKKVRPEKQKKPLILNILDIIIIFCFLLSVWIIYFGGFEIKAGRLMIISMHKSRSPLLILIISIFTRIFAGVFYLLGSRELSFNLSKFKTFIKRMILCIVGIALTFAIFVIPVFVATKDLAREGEYLRVPNVHEAEGYSADLEALFVPVNPALSSLADEIFSGEYRARGEWCIFPGYLSVFCFIYALFFMKNNKRKYFWITGAIFFLLLSLGPILKIDGKTTDISMPFLLLRHLPFIGGLRVPARYGIMMMFCLFILSSLCIADIFSKIKKRNRVEIWRWVVGILIFIFITFEFSIIPFSMEQLEQQKLSKLTIPSGYEYILRNKNEEGCILEFPLGWKDGYEEIGKCKSLLQYYQTFHQRKIVLGDVSRMHRHISHYIKNNPVLMGLASRKLKQLPDKEAFKTLSTLFNVSYIIAHKNMLSGSARKRLKNYFEGMSAVKSVHEDEKMTIYTINLPAKNKYLLDFADSDYFFYPIFGWSRYAGSPDDGTVIYAINNCTRLFLPREKGRGGEFKIVMKTYNKSDTDRTLCNVFFNNRVISTFILDNHERVYIVDLSQESTKNNVNFLDFKIEEPEITVFPFKK